MRKILLPGTILLFVFSMLACQKTPEHIVVVPKDEARMLEMAEDETSGTKITDISFSETEFVDSLQSSDGLVNIDVEAKLLVPDTDVLPLYVVTSPGFDAEIVKAVFASIFKGQKVTCPEEDADTVFTKDDIAARMNEITDKMQDGTWYKTTNYTEEQTQRILDDLMTAYNAAPNEVPANTAADGSMQLVDSGDIVPYYFLGAFGQYGSLQVVSYIGTNSGYCSTLSYSETKGSYSGSLAKVIDGIIPPVYESKMPLTFDEAQAIGYDLFESIGMGEQVRLASAYIVSSSGSVMSDVTNDTSDPYAYKLYYRRMVDHAPVMFVEKDTGFGGHSKSWYYEMFQLIIGERGIQGLKWQAPLFVEAQVSDNTGIIRFEEAYETFKRLMVAIYDAKAKSRVVDDVPDEYSIRVSEIGLEYARIREQDSPDREGYLVPAWVFYGSVDRTSSYYEDGVTKRETSKSVSLEPILVINAITGSIIDLQEGY